MQKMNKIYILLPVHNRKEITIKFIQCLKSQVYENYHLIVIDDGSTDGTSDLIKKEINSSTVIIGNGNLWWAGSLDQGYQWLKCHATNMNDLVLIMNNDTTFCSDFLSIVSDVAFNKDKTLILAQCYSQKTKELIDSGVNIDWRYFRIKNVCLPKDINCLSTRGLIIKLQDFFDIGSFHPKLLPHYTSDYEFTIRASRKGYCLTSEPLLKIWLDEDQTGYHTLKYDSNFIDFLKQIFSKKSSNNPIFSSIFVILACPLRWKVLNLFRIWRAFFSHCYFFIKYTQKLRTLSN